MIHGASRGKSSAKAVPRRATRLAASGGRIDPSARANRVGATASAISRYENAKYNRYELRTLQKIGRLKISLEQGPKTHRAV